MGKKGNPVQNSLAKVCAQRKKGRPYVCPKLWPHTPDAWCDACKTLVRERLRKFDKLPFSAKVDPDYISAPITARTIAKLVEEEDDCDL